MGKTKGKKHREERLESVGGGGGGRSEESVEANPEARTLLAELGSLNEASRIKACRLLGNLFSVSTHGRSKHGLCTSAMLTKLQQRMLDSSANVRVEASGAIHNMACTESDEIICKMVDAGIVRTSISLVCGSCSSSGASLSGLEGLSTSQLNLVVEQLLLAISNMCVYSVACDEFVSSPQAVPCLLHLIVSGPTLAIQVAASQVLIVISENNVAVSQQIIEARGIEALLRCLLGAPPPTSHQRGVAFPYSSIIVALRCGGALVNIYSCQQVSTEIKAQCQIASVVAKVASYLQPNEHILEESTSYVEFDAAQESGHETPQRASSGACEIINTAAELLANLAYCVRNNSEVEEGGDEAGGGGDVGGGGGSGGMLVDQQQYSAAAISGEEEEVEIPLTAEQLALMSTLAEGNVFPACLHSLSLHYTALRTIVSKVSETPLSITSFEIIDAIDRLATLLSNLVGCDEVFLAGSTETVFSLLIEIVNCCIEVILGTTRSTDEAGNEITLMPLSESLDHSAARTLFSGSCASVLKSFLVIVESASGEALLSAEMLKKIATMACRGTSIPAFEVSLQIIDLIGALGEKDVLSPPINAILTNLLLRRIDKPSAFLLSSSSQDIIDKSVDIVRGCLSSLVDLHSSDDAALAENLSKLNGLERMARANTLLPRDDEVAINVTSFLHYKGHA